MPAEVFIAKCNDWTLYDEFCATSPDVDTFRNNDNPIIRVDIRSKRNPHHAFRIGYWYDEYGDDGFCDVVSEITGLDFTSVIKEPYLLDNEMYNEVDWEYALDIAKRMRDGMEKFVASPAGWYRARRIYNNTRTLTKSKTSIDVINTFINSPSNTTITKADDIVVSQNCVRINDNSDVCGIITTMHNGEICSFIISRDATKYAWYYIACDIIVETISYVIDTGNPQAYRMLWKL